MGYGRASQHLTRRRRFVEPKYDALASHLGDRSAYRKLATTGRHENPILTPRAKLSSGQERVSVHSGRRVSQHPFKLRRRVVAQC